MELLKREQSRIAAERATAQKTLAENEVRREHVEANLQRALSLLDNAQAQYRSVPSTVRRQMNQAVFTRLWLVEDEIAGADLTAAYRRLLADDLEGEIAAEEAREHFGRTRTTDLWMTPVKDEERSSEASNVTYLSDYVQRERPNGRLRWETKNPGPLQVRGSNPCLLVAGTGFESVTSGL
jgi:hypothetical protein